MSHTLHSYVKLLGNGLNSGKTIRARLGIMRSRCPRPIGG